MTPHNMTSYHRAQLQKELIAARANVEASTEYAIATGATMPKTDPDDVGMKLYLSGGYWAMIFCLWFAFVSPIVLILTHWD